MAKRKRQRGKDGRFLSKKQIARRLRYQREKRAKNRKRKPQRKPARKPQRKPSRKPIQRRKPKRIQKRKTEHFEFTGTIHEIFDIPYDPDSVERFRKQQLKKNPDAFGYFIVTGKDRDKNKISRSTFAMDFESFSGEDLWVEIVDVGGEYGFASVSGLQGVIISKG